MFRSKRRTTDNSCPVCFRTVDELVEGPGGMLAFSHSGITANCVSPASRLAELTVEIFALQAETSAETRTVRQQRLLRPVLHV